MTILFWVWFVLIMFFCFVVFSGAPFVPSKKHDVEEAFKKLYPLGKKDYVVDLGSGNGKVLIIANNFGARGMGVELNPLLVIFSWLRTRTRKGLRFVCGNMYHFDFPKETTVVYLFGVERDSRKILKAIQDQANRLHKTLYVISYATRLGENVKPIKNHRAYYLFEIKEQKNAD